MRPIRDSVRLGQTMFGYIYHNVFFTFESFHVFTFLDCTEVRSCRPGVDTILPLVWDLQRTFFSNYFKDHCLKFQVFSFPDGMIGSIFGCYIRQNYNGVLNMSALNDYLQDILEPMGDTFLYPAIYCYVIYQLAETIINRYSNLNGIEKIINFKMAVQRIFIEHMFSDVKKSFQIFQAKRQQSVT